MDPQRLAQIKALNLKQSEVQEDLERVTKQCERLQHDIDQLNKHARVSAQQEQDTAPLPADAQTFNSPLDSEFAPKDSTDSEPSLIEAIQLGRSKTSVTPPALPVQAASSQPAPVGASGEVSSLQGSTAQEKPAKANPESAAASAASAETKTHLNAGEWELNFGQVWLVRIGVLFLLTGLIFLSTYAYKNWLFHTGPAVKVSFFMLISLSLTGLGLWLEKKKARLLQYGRVLAAGGLSAGYYTLYAAHFTPSLKLVHNPILAGALLTAWAGGMLAYAAWKQSRIVAVMAIGLAFYGTIINPAGWLSLFSSLLLSSAGIWLLIRFRWVAIGLGTVIAAYASHAFWLGYYPHSVPEPLRLAYLGSYWLLFTAALTVPQTRLLDLKIQRAICAINNGAAWSLTVFIIPSFAPHPSIGWISMAIGLFWILLAVFIRAIKTRSSGVNFHPSLMVIFGYQGLLILSLGFLLQSTGYTRFLVLAVEACVLLLGARYFGGRLARLASAAAFLSAVLTALPHSASAPLAPWPSYLAFSIIIAGYTALVRRDRQQQKASGAIAICPALTTWLALSAGVFYAWNHLAGITGIGVCSATLMLCYFKLKKPWWLKDLAILSVFPALAGAWGLVLHHHETSTLYSLPLILSLALFTGFAPALSAAWDTFWRESTEAVTEENNKMACETVSKAGEPALAWLFSIATWTTILLTAISHPLSGSQWMFAAGAMAISGHGIAQWMQRKSIGFPACAIHLFSFYGLLISSDNTPWLGWLPALMFLVHLLVADTRWPVLGKKQVLRVLAFGLLAATGIQAFQLYYHHGLAYPELLLTGLGVCLLGWNHHRKDAALAAFAAIPALLLSCIISLLMHGHQDGLRYLPILLGLLSHAALWLKKDKNDSWRLPRAAILTVTLICLFAASSLHVRASFSGGGLSICWALLAVLMFSIGLLMRCRPYRLVGLGWLTASVIHVIAIDVMRLGTLGRILSFITLGLVLLILGFLYNRFQDTIRKFL